MPNISTKPQYFEALSNPELYLPCSALREAWVQISLLTPCLVNCE